MYTTIPKNIVLQLPDVTHSIFDQNLLLAKVNTRIMASKASRTRHKKKPSILRISRLHPESPEPTLDPAQLGTKVFATWWIAKKWKGNLGSAQKEVPNIFRGIRGTACQDRIERIPRSLLLLDQKWGRPALVHCAERVLYSNNLRHAGL